MKYELVNGSLDETTPMVLKLLRVFWAALQNLLMGGVVYGFASLGPMLHVHETKGGAGLSTKYCQVMFFVAVSVSCLSPLLAGAIMDAAGPRWTSVFYSTVFAFGAHIFARSEKTFGLFIPGMMLMAFAGPGITMAANYTCAYFPQQGSLVSNLLSICFHLSFLVFFALDRLWEEDRKAFDAGLDIANDDGYKSIFENYSYLCAGSVLVTLILHSGHESAYVPLADGDEDSSDGKIKSQQKSAELERAKEDNERSVLSGGSSSTAGGSAPAPAPAIAPLTEKDRRIITNLEDLRGGASIDSESTTPFDEYRHLTLSEKLASPAFTRLAIFFAMTTFWINFYIGTMETSLGDSMLVSYKEHPLYAKQFSVVLSLGFFFIPVFNWLLDQHGRFTFSLVLGLIALLSLLWSICVLWSTEDMLLPTFICYAVLRTAIFCFIFPYTQDVFGAEYRDVLVGVLFLIAGAVGLAQVPLALWADGTCADRQTEETSHMFRNCDQGRWEYVNLAKAASSLYYFYFAYQEWTDRRHYYNTAKGRTGVGLRGDARHMPSYGATPGTGAGIEMR